MRKLRAGVYVAMAVMALAACSKKTGPEDGGDGPATAPADAPGGAPAVPATPAPGTDMGPGLKAGVWEMTTSVPGMVKGMTMKMCLDEGLSKKFTELGSSNKGKMDCSNKTVNRSGSTIDIAAVCHEEGRNVNMKIHVEMQGDNAYHQTMDMTYDPPVAGKSGMSTTVDGKWLGSCDDNKMKAGDMEMGGMKMNMSAMKKPG